MASTIVSKSNASITDNINNDSPFTLNSVLISKDLSSLPPSEIKDYRGLADLPAQEIHSVLCLLTPGNLTKVLTNIPSEDLLNMNRKLSPLTFQSILNGLPEDNRTQILNRTRL
jgi:hypothetical protein